MGRCVVPEADEILDREFPVLDKGFVRLVDYMGSDQRIVQAARVSYGEGTKTVRQDAGLIDYLLRNEHTSPFEQVVFTFHAKLPVFVARQWVRHRTARLNEISGRYSVMADEFYVPDREDVAEQSLDNKQGRKTEAMAPDKAEEVRRAINNVHKASYAGYRGLLDD
ncbi:MAG: FAD-dependent thymidylate synthase, partial [Spirochaetaceae bacterium]|nr:FAD-dependent thymidylate synthase [Spirochaetaceae bacterium]